MFSSSCPEVARPNACAVRAHSEPKYVVGTGAGGGDSSLTSNESVLVGRGEEAESSGKEEAEGPGTGLGDLADRERFRFVEADGGDKLVPKEFDAAGEVVVADLDRGGSLGGTGERVMGGIVGRVKSGE